ncbi:MAG: hypothetical protein Q9227_004357 [Pyrenula ochraceoflavens]
MLRQADWYLDALTLEYLERDFYQQGLQNYTQEMFVAAGFPDPFYTNLQTIAADEKTHVSFLSTALGSAATKELQYSFGVTTPRDFVTLSSVLEGVGVSAYLGAAGSIMNKTYLEAAGSILSVEARHSAYIRSSLGNSPVNSPFETPLDFNQVYSLAAPFISDASNSAKLPFMAFPMLMASTMAVKTGDAITFTNGYANAKMFDSAITDSTPVYAVFFNGLNKMPMMVEAVGNDYMVDHVPEGIMGATYIMLGTSDTMFTDEQFLAGPAVVEVTCVD